VGAHTLAGLESIRLVSSQSAPSHCVNLPREYTLEATVTHEGYAASVTLDTGDPDFREGHKLEDADRQVSSVISQRNPSAQRPADTGGAHRLLGWNQYVSLASQSAPKSLRDAGDPDYRGDTNLRTPIAKYRQKLKRGTHTIVFASTTPPPSRRVTY
jgi:hypothetical protein